MTKATQKYLKTHVAPNLDSLHRKKLERILRRRNDEELHTFVCESLNSKDNLLVGRAIIIAEKAEMKDRPIVALILWHLKNGTVWVRQRAADAMIVLGSKREVKDLSLSLHDRDSLVRSYVCEALGKIGDKKSVLRLRKLLSDKSDLVRAAALDSLAAFPKCISYQALFLLFDKEKSWFTRLSLVMFLEVKWHSRRHDQNSIVERINALLKKERNGLVRFYLLLMLYRYTGDPAVHSQLINLWPKVKRGL